MGKTLYQRLHSHPDHTHHRRPAWIIGQSRRPSLLHDNLWYRANGRVFLFEGLERGRLYDLDETMSLVQAHRNKATRLPVVQIRRELYDAAVAQYQALNEGVRSNRAFYTVMDNLQARINLLKGRHGFTNCIHAVADTGARAGLTYLQTHGLRGISASRAVNNYLSQFVIARNPEWDSIYDSRFP